MVSQFIQKFNLQVRLIIGTVNPAVTPFQKKYDDALNRALSPGSLLVFPCTGERILIGTPKPKTTTTNPSFKKDGTYTRTVIDAYWEISSSGTKRLNFSTEEISVQLIETSSGHDHAVLTNLLVPYEQLSTSACIAIVYMYYSSNESMQDFCDGLVSINLTVEKLTQMIEWVKKTFPLLAINVTPENNTEESKREAYKKGINQLYVNQLYYHMLCIQVTHLAPFQRRKPVCSPHLTGIPFV